MYYITCTCTILHVHVLYYIHKYHITCTYTILHVHVLYYMYMCCITCTCTILHEHVPYYMDMCHTTWTCTILHVHVSYYMYMYIQIHNYVLNNIEHIIHFSAELVMWSITYYFRFPPRCPDPPVILADSSAVINAMICLRQAQRPLVIIGKGIHIHLCI